MMILIMMILIIIAMSGKNQYNNKIKKKYLYGIFMPIMILLCINITEKFYLNMIYKNLHKKNKK